MTHQTSGGGDEIVVSPKEARQASKRHRVIRVLAVSLVLALVAFVALMLWVWRAAPSVP
jgi:hypothetical protein